MESKLNLGMEKELIIRNITKDLGNGMSRVVIDEPLFIKYMQTSRAHWAKEKPLLKWSLVVDENGESTGTIVIAFEGKDKEIVPIYYYSQDTGETNNVFSKKDNQMKDMAIYEPIFFMDTVLANKYLAPYVTVKAPFDIKAMDFSTPEVK